ncbi:hypothetical protein [Niabella drilacis]|uniref:hypothetical protein n=1 Tax=Niabella drilacis (strain DSM 25811 / CCM 8410 / CCUG 62505 / LMG 26954 / E90) TaxID=1285928 RepID=UPI000B86EE21|nr:hypothetical protein [Niabella drilacis]
MRIYNKTDLLDLQMTGRDGDTITKRIQMMPGMKDSVASPFFRQRGTGNRSERYNGENKRLTV